MEEEVDESPNNQLRLLAQVSATHFQHTVS